MRKIIMLLIALFYIIFVLTVVMAQVENIAVNSPPDGTSVLERPIVGGSVAGNVAQVWVIVHPMETSDYWVQPKVAVRRGGLWRVQVYIGQPGSIDVGKHFEIMAVANPRRTLREGLVLGTWPEAESQSAVIEVIRR